MRNGSWNTAWITLDKFHGCGRKNICTNNTSVDGKKNQKKKKRNGRVGKLRHGGGGRKS